MRTYVGRLLNPRCSAKLVLVLSLALSLVFDYGRPANAACTTCSCTVATTSLTFGTYVFTDPAPTNATGSIAFLCTSASPASGNLTISLSSGGGTFGARAMRNGASTLRYNLYADPAHSTIFGDGSSGTIFYNSGTFAIGLSAFSGSASVYGSIPAGQGAIPPGPYADTITETISF